MATATLWKNVAVSMQSALGSDLTITGITKANPAVITSAGHGLSNGEYVVLTVQGMHQMDGKVVRVASVATDTFAAEGVDSTSFDTFSSGTANEITFGTSFGTLTSLSASGGDFDFVDTTTIHSAVKTQVPGLANPATYSFESMWDVADAGLIAAKAASDAQGKRAFKFTFGTGGQIAVFSGYIGATLLPVGGSQDLVKTNVAITMFGTPTYYAS